MGGRFGRALIFPLAVSTKPTCKNTWIKGDLNISLTSLAVERTASLSFETKVAARQYLWLLSTLSFAPILKILIQQSLQQGKNTVNVGVESI